MFAATSAANDGWSHEVWAFLGVALTQFVILVTVLLNRGGHRKTNRKLTDIEAHVNNVEVDIDHDADDVSLGQRLRRMEAEMRVQFTENSRIHELLAKGLTRNAEEVFKRAMYAHDDIGSYILHRGGPAGWEVTWVSPAYTALTGMTLDQVRQGDYLDRIDPDDRDRVMSTFRTSLEAEVSWEVTYRQRGAHGWQTLSQQAEPYFSIKGELIGQFGLFRVVDEDPTDA